MLALELARELRGASASNSRVLVGINHSDTGSGMYGTVLVTQATKTIAPSGEIVLLLAGAASCSPDDESIEAEQRMLQHPDLMEIGDLIMMLESDDVSKLRVFHTLSHGRNDPSIWADESGFWDETLPERVTPAGPRVAMVDIMRDESEQRRIEYPAVIDLWNMADHFEI